MKRCSGCLVEKTRESFPGDSTKKDGLNSKCKDCNKIRLATARRVFFSGFFAALDAFCDLQPILRRDALATVKAWGEELERDAQAFAADLIRFSDSSG